MRMVWILCIFGLCVCICIACRVLVIRGDNGRITCESTSVPHKSPQMIQEGITNNFVQKVNGEVVQKVNGDARDKEQNVTQPLTAVQDEFIVIFATQTGNTEHALGHETTPNKVCFCKMDSEDYHETASEVVTWRPISPDTPGLQWYMSPHTFTANFSIMDGFVVVYFVVRAHLLFFVFDIQKKGFLNAHTHDFISRFIKDNCMPGKHLDVFLETHIFVVFGNLDYAVSFVNNEKQMFSTLPGSLLIHQHKEIVTIENCAIFTPVHTTPTHIKFIVNLNEQNIPENRALETPQESEEIVIDTVGKNNCKH